MQSSTDALQKPLTDFEPSAFLSQARQPEPQPSRPEAVRRLLSLAATGETPAPAPSSMSSSSGEVETLRAEKAVLEILVESLRKRTQAQRKVLPTPADIAAAVKRAEAGRKQ